MHLPLFFHGLTAAPPLRPALQAAIVGAAAVAGYVTFLPLTSRTGPAGTVIADVEQPQWAGHIERPDMDAPPPSAPITSASYLVPEAVALDNAKKNGAAAAVMPRAAGKTVLPPRRPASTDEAVRASAPSAVLAPVPAPIAPAAGTPVPPAPIPVLVATAETPAKPVSRNMFSPVTDRLPTSGNLMKPFHFVGDTFHNLIKSF